MCGDPGWAYRREAPSRTFIRPMGGFHHGLARVFIERPVSATCRGVEPEGAKTEARRAETEATGFRCISSGTSLSAYIDILPFIGICKALKLHFYFPKERNEISELHNGSTAADAAVTSRRIRGSMKSTLRVDEIPACAGMKCSRVAPARNTRAKLGYVAGLFEPH